MTKNSIAIIVCWWSISTIAMMETLREKAADALIKKWLDLPGLALPTVQEIARIPSDIQNDLIRKIMVPVYQFFVQKAVWDVAQKINTQDINFVVDTKMYVDSEIETLKNERVLRVTFSDDISRALIQLHNTVSGINDAVLLYIFDPSQNKYQSVLRFKGESFSAMNKDGQVLALCHRGKRGATCL